MSTDRRGFFAKLVGGSASVVALSALQSIAPEAQATELRRDRQYLIKLSRRVSEETRHRISMALNERGINAILFDDMIGEIYEINQP